MTNVPKKTGQILASLGLSMETSPSVFPFFSASLNLSAEIIYYGLEGVILWGRSL